ncbi:MAG TPA: hypothetical protein VF668_07870 [Pyrinomonadaceae bacterium]|jgi:hypothetical protein
MSKDGRTISEERPPAPLERGEILSHIKRWARIGYTQEVGGGAEDFERRWREAFHADEPAGKEVGAERRRGA